jgi:hypothetical protein
MNHTILRIKMNLRGFREEIWKGWSVFLIILAEGIRNKNVKFLSAPNLQRTQLARVCTTEAEPARKQIHRRGNPPPVAICETAALFTGGQSEPK